MNVEQPKFVVKNSEPMMIAISGISGAGKDTIINRMKDFSDFPFHFVVTCNTRPIRKNEVDGVDYHFISREEFITMIENDQMLEFSRVYDDFKGVPRFEIDNAIADGKDTILRVDIQGMVKMRAFNPDLVSIFVIPPDYDTWMTRLTNRNGDTEESMRLRIQTARKEIEQICEFDYLVVNDCVDTAAQEIIQIIQAERFNTCRRKVLFANEDSNG